MMLLSDKLLLCKPSIETVNEELKNKVQVKHSRYRTFDNFIVNLFSTIAANCYFPLKTYIDVTRKIDTQFVLFRIRRTHIIYSSLKLCFMFLFILQ